MSQTQKTYSAVPCPNLIEELNAIPVAKPGMKPNELRKICLDYMKLQISFQYLPDRDYDYIVDSKQYPVSLKKASLHGGIPYVTIGTGNLYRIAEYYDPKTGMLDLSKLGENKQIFGNACSGAASSAWARCISSAKLGFTFDMTQYNGFINVGPYQYPKTVQKFIRFERNGDQLEKFQSYNPKNVCQENGKQVMFESYALVQPADGLLNPGHIRMASSVATVFRNNDGTIDGKRSFLLYCDQVCYENAWHHIRCLEDGEQYRVHGGLDVRVTFDELFATNYIPFTFKEFLGQTDVQKAKINANTSKTAFSVDELKEVVIDSNYPISDLFVQVIDPNGNVLYSHVARRTVSSPEEWDLYQMALADHIPLDELRPFEEGGQNSLVVKAQLLKGQISRAYAGRLMPGKSATQVKDPLTPEKLDAIPLAKPGMKPEQLRKICLDYMRLQISFQYIPSEDYRYLIRSKNHRCFLEKGLVYAGLPYITVGSGSLYRIMEFYDPKTGVLDMTEFAKTDKRYFGNACSGGAGSSWSRCITSAKTNWTAGMTHANGFLRVGPYQYPDKLSAFNNKKSSKNYYSTGVVCRENGEQVMFESYALTKPADGIVNVDHVRMVSSVPTVVRNEDGTIDGEKSYLFYCDQSSFTHLYERNHARMMPDGSHYTVQGGENVKFTFSDMYRHSYIPFTFKEFLGEAAVQLPEIKPNIVKTEFYSKELADVTFASNYPISDVFFTVTDQDGNEVFRKTHRSINFQKYKICADEFVPVEEISAFEDGNHSVKIEFQLYYGSKETVYTGTLKAKEKAVVIH